VITLSPFADTARIRLSNAPLNGSEDLIGVPIKTLDKIQNGDKCLIISIGEQLSNSFVIASARKGFDLNMSLIVSREEFDSLKAKVEQLTNIVNGLL
jgi:hypothetical protein